MGEDTLDLAFADLLRWARILFPLDSVPAGMGMDPGREPGVQGDVS